MKEVSQTEMLEVNAIIDKCGCYCHNPDRTTMHMIDCCKYSTRKKFQILIQEEKNDQKKTE